MELISNAYHSLYKIKFIGIRFFSVFGPWGRPDMSIYKFSKKIINQKQIEIYNYGKYQKTLAYQKPLRKIEQEVYGVDINDKVYPIKK